MLTVPAHVTRTHLPLTYVSSNIVPVVVIMALTPTGEARTIALTWREAHNVHGEAQSRLDALIDAGATVYAVLEGEEDISTGEVSLTF